MSCFNLQTLLRSQDWKVPRRQRRRRSFEGFRKHTPVKVQPNTTLMDQNWWILKTRIFVLGRIRHQPKADLCFKWTDPPIDSVLDRFRKWTESLSPMEPSASWRFQRIYTGDSGTAILSSSPINHPARVLYWPLRIREKIITYQDGALRCEVYLTSSPSRFYHFIS